jgi:hypothetical protein
MIYCTANVEELNEGDRFKTAPGGDTIYFVKEHFDDLAGRETKAQKEGGNRALVFIAHGRKVYKICS